MNPYQNQGQNYGQQQPGQYQNQMPMGYNPNQQQQFPQQGAQQYPQQSGQQYQPQGGQQYPQQGGQQFPPQNQQYGYPMQGQQYPQQGGQQYPQQGGQQFPQQTGQQFPQQTGQQFPQDPNLYAKPMDQGQFQQQQGQNQGQPNQYGQPQQQQMVPFVSGQADVNNNNLNHNKMLIWFQFRTNRIMTYNTQTKQWQSLPNNSNFYFNEHFRVAQLPDCSFLMTGGSDQNERILSTTLLFTQGNVQAKKSMNVPRRAHSSVYNNGYVYVFGGINEKSMLNQCERFNLNTNSWESINSMSTPRSLTSACSFNNDAIYVFGGYSERLNKELDLVERYDLNTGVFKTCGYRLNNIMQNPFTIQLNSEEILIMGGFNDTQEDFTEVLLLNVYTGEFKPKSNLNIAGWGIYSPVYTEGKFFMLMTGEELDQQPPDLVEYNLS